MKRLAIGCTFLICLLASCGGVIGNIEKYSFSDVNPDGLRAALSRVYIKYPELIKSDTIIYGNNNGTDFYFLLENEGQKNVFKCSIIIYPAPYDKEIDLSLTTAVTWGDTMRLASEMGFFEKRKYKKLFKTKILPKIKAELKD